ncbi:helix-turn-helix domain-containing protein [Rasiella sp. SM2506]|uniref:helix-turn-helix domain-containing protein n=1 Tax=Rasiella sp. SM2506 TaxID=3423914 RepID=UPI003D7AF7BE
MTIFKVNSLPVLEVIKDLAKAFNTNYKMDVCEYSLKIPEMLGTGEIRAYHLENGLGIITYDCTFYNDLEIHFIVNDVHPLKFIYILKGNLDHTFENEKSIHSIEEYQSAMIASSNTNGHILYFKANTSVAKYCVEIDRKAFNLDPAFQNKDVDLQLYTLFKDIKADEAFYYKGDYSLTIADIFSDIKKNDDLFDGDKLVYKFYMESIAYQTLVMHLSQFLDDQRGNNKQKILRKREFEQFKKVVDYITTNLENYCGIDELTKVSGLNALKLQKGFKYLYNTTINQFVQEKRLEKAKDLLTTSDKSINEIVVLIGFKSASYFSRIFKEKYGVQPSLFKKN